MTDLMRAGQSALNRLDTGKGFPGDTQLAAMYEAACQNDHTAYQTRLDQLELDAWLAANPDHDDDGSNQ